MSTTNNLPTRQQLEEIDALLKRMLSLPPLAMEPREDPASITPAPMATVQQPAPAVVPETRVQSWRVEWPQSQAAPTPSTEPTVAPNASVTAWGSPVTPSSTPAPNSSRFSVYAPPVTPTPSVPYVSPPFSPAYPPGYAPGDYPKTPVPAVLLPGPSVITPQPAASKPVAESNFSAILLPLIILNGIYDVLTYVLPMGSWLRTTGRTWLGRFGVLMILSAIGWGIGEWYGIDWPKIDFSKINLSRFGWAK